MRFQMDPNGKAHTGIVAARTFLSVLVLGLSAYIVNWYTMTIMTSSPGELSFLLFASLWSIVTTIATFVVPRITRKAFHPYAAIAVASTNVAFFGAGFIALAVFLNRINFCRGMVCNAARADNVFAAFIFALWTATEAVLVLDLFKQRSPSGQQVMRKEMNETGELE